MISVPSTRPRPTGIFQTADHTEDCPSDSHLGHYRRRKLRHGFRRRAATEPVIGHLESDHRLRRNFLKGIVGDALNAMLAAAAFNFKRVMNKWKHLSSIFVRVFSRHILPPHAWYNTNIA